jgi:hypothetical protein
MFRSDWQVFGAICNAGGAVARRAHQSRVFDQRRFASRRSSSLSTKPARRCLRSSIGYVTVAIFTGFVDLLSDVVDYLHEILHVPFSQGAVEQQKVEQILGIWRDKAIFDSSIIEQLTEAVRTGHHANQVRFTFRFFFFSRSRFVYFKQCFLYHY